LKDALDGLPRGMDAVDLALRRLRSARAQPTCPARRDQALEGASLVVPRETMTPAEIHALAQEAIAHLYEVTVKLAELSALLGADDGTP
jgi:hypothetical protein